jgi:hypothetical protein
MDTVDAIIRRGKQLHRLGKLIRERLGPVLEPHCHVANLRDNTLVLLVSSTVWASRLRYQVPQLLQDFQQDDRLSGITAIDIRVSPANNPKPPQQPRRASMSADAALCIQRCADSVDDGQLKSALEQLARRKKNPES